MKKIIGYLLGSLSFVIPMFYILIYVNGSNFWGAVITGGLFELTFYVGVLLITRDLEEENKKLKSMMK